MSYLFWPFLYLQAHINMIILRKISTETATAAANLVHVAGDFAGTKDGFNKTFLTEYTYEPDRITIYYNGQALHAPYDFYQTGLNRITFINIAPDNTDTIKTTYEKSLVSLYQDLDLIYNNGVWESSASTYTSLPSYMKVHVNGLKQDDAYYQVTINAGKIEVSFGFYTGVNDWVNLEAPMLDDQDLTFSGGVWYTLGGSYTTTSGLQVYLNGKKHNSDYYTTTISGGKIGVTFNSITSSNDWVNLDTPASYSPQKVNLIYVSGSWETLSSSYLSLPQTMKVYVNGIKQNDDYYVVILSSGKLKVIFDFITTETDWVNILILQ